MRTGQLIIVLLMLLASCRQKENKGLELMAFDQQKWMLQENGSYKYRSNMVMDLIRDKRLTGTSTKNILQMLGAPTRTDSNYYFYRLSQEKMGAMILHTRTLVLKFENDTIAWAKIHQ